MADEGDDIDATVADVAHPGAAALQVVDRLEAGLHRVETLADTDQHQRNVTWPMSGRKCAKDPSLGSAIHHSELPLLAVLASASNVAPQSDSVSIIGAIWPNSNTSSAVLVANMCITRAIKPVQPVW